MLGKGGASLEATLNGCKIHYTLDCHKDPAAPVVVLLHGWGCDGNIFNYLKNEIAKQSSVLTIDFPGHGQSDEPPEPWGVPEYTAQLNGLLRELQLTKINVVAHSFGGRVALELAASQPELIEKLVITGGAGLRKQPTEEQKKR
jgi:pimeloyl-ACP methyl ester carboxylesterase